MGKLLRFDKTRNLWVYDGLLTADDKAQVDDIINTIKTEIPEIEKELDKQYGKSVLNKFNLGMLLSDYIEKYDLNMKDRRLFWIEIGKMASTEKHSRTENNTSKRNYYEECYILSKIPLETISKLSWRQWSNMLDRSDEYDERIYKWIEEYPNKIKEDQWRHFLKAHHLFFKDKDSLVFSDEEIKEIYNSFLLMSDVWEEKIKDFAKKFPTSEKLNKAQKWSSKYQEECFKNRRQFNLKTVNRDICELSFDNVYGAE